MAKKIPPPLMPPPPQQIPPRRLSNNAGGAGGDGGGQQGVDGGRRTDSQPEDDRRRNRNFSAGNSRDSFCDLPPLSSSASSTPRRSSPTDRGLGARPRTQSVSGAMMRPSAAVVAGAFSNMMGTPPPSPSPTEIRGNRRRLDSLHLDPPRHTENQSDNDHFFHFGRYLVPSFWSDGDPMTSSPPPCVTSSATMLQGEELYLHFFHERLRSEGLRDFSERDAGLDAYHHADTHFFNGAAAAAAAAASGDQFSPATTSGSGHYDDDEDGGSPDANADRRRVRTWSMNLENFQDPIWRQTGRDLQILADRFAQSHERLLVRQRAEQVDISTLNKDKFIAMLSELFKGGCVTRERILVLFFFCSDVAIFAIRTGAGRLLASLTEWSLIFIKDQVCSWVQNNGGWREVLRSGFNLVQQSLIFGSCAMFIVCCAIYIKKNLSLSSSASS